MLNSKMIFQGLIISQHYGHVEQLKGMSANGRLIILTVLSQVLPMCKSAIRSLMKRRLWSNTLPFTGSFKGLSQRVLSNVNKEHFYDCSEGEFLR